MLIALPNQISLLRSHASLIVHEQLKTNTNLPLRHTGQLEISASLHTRYQNADQQKPDELNQERGNFIPKRCYIDAKCRPESLSN